MRLQNFAIVTLTFVAACYACSASAQNATAISNVSAVVLNVTMNQGAAFGEFVVTVTNATGDAVKIFDSATGPLPGPVNRFASYGVLTIQTQLCATFPAPQGFQCGWVNMSVSDITKMGSNNPGVPNPSGVYLVNAKIDNSPFDNSTLLNRKEAHPFLVRAAIFPSRAATLGNAQPAATSAAECVAVWPAIVQ